MANDENKNFDTVEHLNPFNKVFEEYFPILFERYINDPYKYGERVKELRESKGLTSRELAQLIGISHSNIVKIENGLFKKINLNTLHLLSNYFNCSYVYLLGKSNSKSASGKNYCFTNAYTNIELLNFLQNNVFSDNNDTSIRVYSADTPSAFKEYSIYGKYNLNKFLKDVKETSYGLVISVNQKTYYTYYFSAKNFNFCKPSTNLTATEKHIAYKDTNIIEPEDFLTFFSINRKKISDVLIIQDCSDINCPVLFSDNNKNTNSLYLEIIKELFYPKNYAQIENREILDVLYVLRDRLNGDVIRHISSLIADEILSPDAMLSLLDIISDYIRMPDAQRNKLCKYSIELSK